MNDLSSIVERDLQTWLKLYGSRLRSFFRKRANDDEVDDLIQEVFLHLQEMPTTTVIGNPEHYVFTVARNILVARYRHQTVRLNDYGQDLSDCADNISPERIAIGREEYARALKAILGLPPRTRAAFQFHRFDNMTYREIAERMGVSKESVKELMHRAIVRIMKEMDVDG